MQHSKFLFGWETLKMSLLFLLSSLTFSVSSQSSSLQSIDMAYLAGSIRHPGVKIGLTYSIKHWEKEKTKPKSKVKTKQLVLSPQIAWYNHKQNHSALLSSIELGYETGNNNRNFKHTWALGLGMVNQFNKGITYTLDDAGNFQENKRASRTYLTPNLAYDFTHQLNQALDIYTRASLGFKLNYNTFFSILHLLELGIKYKMNVHDPS